MGQFSRDKGQRAERQVAALLQPIVTAVYGSMRLEAPAIKRNLEQTQSGGFDLIGLTWLALEVKHCEVFQIDQWWEQCKRQAVGQKEPVLFYKKNNVKWKVKMYGELRYEGISVRTPVVISVDAFLAYMRRRIRIDLEKML